MTPPAPHPCPYWLHRLVTAQPAARSSSDNGQGPLQMTVWTWRGGASAGSCLAAAPGALSRFALLRTQVLVPLPRSFLLRQETSGAAGTGIVALGGRGAMLGQMCCEVTRRVRRQGTRALS